MELKLDHISKRYGKKQALNDVNAVLTPGIYALLGPNGAGKTTLEHIIADVLTPTSGTVFWNGTPIHTLGSVYRRQLGFLPQNPGFYPNFTAVQLLDYFALLKRVQNRRERIEELLELVNLKEDRNRRVGGFSGGMTRRLGIAVALLSDPQLLLLDEPTAGLDPKERVRFRNILSSLGKEKIVIISTHIVSDVEMIARRVILIKKGKLVEIATPDTLRNQLKDRVWECRISNNQAESIMKEYSVGSMSVGETHTIMRIFGDIPPIGAPVPTPPTLEDVYLYHFAKETECEQ